MPGKATDRDLRGRDRSAGDLGSRGKVRDPLGPPASVLVLPGSARAPTRRARPHVVGKGAQRRRARVLTAIDHSHLGVQEAEAVGVADQHIDAPPHMHRVGGDREVGADQRPPRCRGAPQGQAVPPPLEAGAGVVGVPEVGHVEPEVLGPDVDLVHPVQLDDRPQHRVPLHEGAEGGLEPIRVERQGAELHKTVARRASDPEVVLAAQEVRALDRGQRGRACGVSVHTRGPFLPIHPAARIRHDHSCDSPRRRIVEEIPQPQVETQFVAEGAEQSRGGQGLSPEGEEVGLGADLVTVNTERVGPQFAETIERRATLVTVRAVRRGARGGSPGGLPEILGAGCPVNVRTLDRERATAGDHRAPRRSCGDPAQQSRGVLRIQSVPQEVPGERGVIRTGRPPSVPRHRDPTGPVRRRSVLAPQFHGPAGHGVRGQTEAARHGGQRGHRHKDVGSPLGEQGHRILQGVPDLHPRTIVGP